MPYDNSVSGFDMRYRFFGGGSFLLIDVLPSHVVAPAASILPWRIFSAEAIKAIISPMPGYFAIGFIFLLQRYKYFYFLLPYDAFGSNQKAPPERWRLGHDYVI
jgi:hypothetical protein